MIDQLDMQCRMALLETRRQFTDARLRVRRWEPRPSPWWDLAPEDVPADD